MSYYNDNNNGYGNDGYNNRANDGYNNRDNEDYNDRGNDGYNNRDNNRIHNSGYNNNNNNNSGQHERRRSSSRDRQSSRERQNERLGEPRGEASSYYGAGRDHQQQPYVGDSRYVNHAAGGHGSQQQHGNEPPQYQQYPSTATHSSNSGRESHNQGYQNSYEGPGDAEGERGIMGGIAGGAAGAYGGHTVGGKSGHGTSGTLVGALVGALAGSKGEDKISDWKDERDDKKKHEHEQQQQQQHQSEEHHDDNKPRSGNFVGNFSSTSKDIRLDAHGDFNLHAECRKPNGTYQSSTIALNKFLENNFGNFRWSAQHSSSPSTVTVQQGDTLRAIAARHNCGFEQIAQHNGIQNPDMIYPGQVLNVPEGGSGGGNFGASAKDVRLADGGKRLEAELKRNGEWVHASIFLDEKIGNQNGCLKFV